MATKKQKKSVRKTSTKKHSVKKKKSAKKPAKRAKATKKHSVNKPAKKTKSAKKRSVKRSKSTKSDIDEEKKISKEISLIEKSAQQESKQTHDMEDKIKEIQNEVKEELKSTKQDIKEAKSESRSNKKLIWYVIGAIIGIALIYAIVQLASAEDVDVYNNFEFSKDGSGYWQTQISDRGFIPFYHHPRDVDQIPVDEGALQIISAVKQADSRLYLSLDPQHDLPKQALAAIEISKITTQLYEIRTIGTTLEPTDADDVEVLTCEDNDSGGIVAEFRITGVNEVSYNENNGCININAESVDDFTKVTDAYIYRSLGIIPLE